jgi:type II secretory pathway pseudopilin PulG
VLLAVAIVVVLASVALPGIQSLTRRSRVQACQANMRTLAGAVQWCSADLDRDVEVATGEDLVALLEKGYLATRLVCPDGGSYRCSARGKRCACSQHGDLEAGHPPAAP